MKQFNLIVLFAVCLCTSYAIVITEDFNGGVSPNLWHTYISGEASTSPWNINTSNDYLSISKASDNDIETKQETLIAGLRSSFLIAGDFSVTVGFNLIDFPIASPDGWNEANLYFGDATNAFCFQVLRFTSVSGQRSEAFSSIYPHVIGKTVDNAMSGQFKITRENSTMYAWIDRGNGFAYVGERTSTEHLQPLYLNLWAAQVTPSNRDRPNTSIEVHYDNVEIIADDIIIPEPATLSLLAIGGLAMLRRKR